MRSRTRFCLPLHSAILFLLSGIFLAPSQAQTWTEYGPEARFSHTGVWDQSSGNTIVFGGQDPSTKKNLNDLWLVQTSFSKQIVTTQLNATGTAPAPRYGHTAIYDGPGNIMTVFGGALGTTTPCSNDLWLLEGANGQSGAPAWVSVNASGSLPAARFHASSVYDPTSHSMVVFGGNNCGKTYFNDVWVLSNADGLGGNPTWKQLSPQGTAPSARESMSAVYDAVNNIMTVYGGDANSVQQGDIWTLSNANGNGGTPAWTQLAASGAVPLTRTGQVAIYDSANNRMSIFGGFHFTTALTDTDVLTNANGLGGAPVWSTVSVTGTAPGLGYMSGSYDTAANALYVFAGSSSATKLAGDNHAFAQSNPNGAGASSWVRGGPATRYDQTMFYDSVTGDLFVFAGSHALTNTNFNDLWQLKGATTSSNLAWFPMNVKGSHPSARWGHVAAYDIASNHYMMFGGAQGFPSPCLNDYWVLTGANGFKATPTWVLEKPAGTPPGIRTHHNAIYDAVSNSLLVFGGNNCGSTYYNDVWTLSDANVNVNGSTPRWSQLFPTGTAPRPRENASVVYDPATKMLILYGGDAGGAPFNDIWVLSTATGGAPAWTQLVPSNNGPVARTKHTAIYDAVNNLMTVYAGFDGKNLLSDTWVLSNANGQTGVSTWSQVASSVAGSARDYHTAIYDSPTNQMLIFGGVNTVRPFFTDDHVYSLSGANGQ